MLSAQQTNDSQIQRLLNRCQLGVKVPETRAEKFCSVVLQVRIREFSHQYEQQLRVFWWGDAVYGLQVLQIRIALRRIVPVTTPKIDNSQDHNQQNTHHYTDSQESTGFQRVQGAQAHIAQKETHPHQDPDHHRKDEPWILHSHLGRGRPTEIPSQQYGSKHGRAGIQISCKANKLDDAQVNDEPGGISEPGCSFYGNG